MPLQPNTTIILIVFLVTLFCIGIMWAGFKYIAVTTTKINRQLHRQTLLEEGRIPSVEMTAEEREALQHRRFLQAEADMEQRQGGPTVVVVG
ncbi:hypothetical protein RUND412_006825 [Rhizina undulata]